jgi:hypothetical protein
VLVQQICDLVSEFFGVQQLAREPVVNESNVVSGKNAAGVAASVTIAGPKERAGLTDTRVAVILTIWIGNGVNPMAKRQIV